MNDIHETNRQFWDRISAYWRDLREEDGRWRQLVNEPHLAFEGGLLELIRSAVGDLDGQDVCVIGSGDNYVAFALAGLGARVVSVDISQKQLDVAGARSIELGLEMAFQRADAADLAGLDNDAFDLVVSSNGFFVWISEPAAVFESVHRVLRPGGHYGFYDVHPFTRPWKGPGAPLTMEKSYWDTGPLLDEESDQIEFNWTLADLINPMVGAGLQLLELRESPPESTQAWKDFSYRATDEDAVLADWRSNNLAGLPMWLTVLARKRADG